MENKNSDEGLKRVVGIPALAVSVVNSTIGAGIFILPGIVAVQAGASGIFGYLFCGLVIACVMLCYIEIGSCVTASGGSYTYVLTAFGPLAGFVINCLLFLGWTMLACAALLNALADSLAVLFPAFLNEAIRCLLFFILLFLMVVLNVMSSKNSVRTVKFIALVKLIPLAVIIIIGFNHLDTGNLQMEHLPTAKTIGETALFIFFAFAGFETTLSLSGEIKNPKRTIPAGIIIGGLMILIIYILIQIVVQGSLGAKTVEFKNAPLAAVADLSFSPIGGIIILVVTAVSCFGTVSGDILNSPRVLFAGAKDGLFPKFLSRIHPRFATPYMAIITYAALIFVISISGGFKQLAILASCSILIIYFTVILSMIKLKINRKHSEEKIFKVPGGIIIPLIAITGIIWILSHLTIKEFISTVIFIGIVCMIYFAGKLFKRKSIATKSV